MSGESFLDIIAEAVRRSGTSWHVDVPGAGDPWIRVHRPRPRTPASGWKLHVSATEWSAPNVLDGVLPILLADDASFKVAATTEVLESLNAGEAGVGQMGKFITVYPNDDSQAVRLAERMDHATLGLRGPAVPSDRPLRPGSLVNYRFGAFVEGASDGRPADGADPFLAAGVAEATATAPIVGRYVVVATLHRSPRGDVQLAIDVEGLRSCVLKRARRDARAGSDGTDARDHLRHETEVLRALAPDRRFPGVYDLVEHDGDAFLVMEQVEGETLSKRISGLAAGSRFLSTQEVVAWGRELADALGAMHAKGFVYRDVNSRNVIVGPEGRLRLVDFELAHEMAAGASCYVGGTVGYSSPQQTAGEPGTVTDDVHGLGALLYFMGTGIEPALCPDPGALVERPMRVVNPSIDPGLERIVARCLQPEAAERFQSMHALDAELAGIDAARLGSGMSS